MAYLDQGMELSSTNEAIAVDFQRGTKLPSSIFGEGGRRHRFHRVQTRFGWDFRENRRQS